MSRRHDIERHQRLLDAPVWDATEDVERRIRKIERNTVRELHRKPWLAGRDFWPWIHRCRRRHTDSIERSRQMAAMRIEHGEVRDEHLSHNRWTERSRVVAAWREDR